MIVDRSEISWREVLGDPYAKALTPLMLAQNEYRVDKLSRAIDGRNKSAITITYDRNYVYSWIAKKVLKALRIKSKAEAIALIDRAWDYYERSFSANTSSNGDN